MEIELNSVVPIFLRQAIEVVSSSFLMIRLLVEVWFAVLIKYLAETVGALLKLLLEFPLLKLSLMPCFLCLVSLYLIKCAKASDLHG